MSLLQTILQAQGGAIVSQLAKSSGLDTGNTVAAVAQLLSGLNKGIKKNTAQSGGLNALIKAVQGGNHDRYLKDNKTAFNANAVSDGNNILSHILGNKQASRNLASQVQDQTGISSSVLKKMLPVVATMLMGAMKKQSGGGSNNQLASLFGQQAPAQPQSSMGSKLLSSFLDSDQDGSVVDDLMGMAVKHLVR